MGGNKNQFPEESVSVVMGYFGSAPELGPRNGPKRIDRDSCNSPAPVDIYSPEGSPLSNSKLPHYIKYQNAGVKDQTRKYTFEFFERNLYDEKIPICTESRRFCPLTGWTHPASLVNTLHVGRRRFLRSLRLLLATGKQRVERRSESL